MIMAFGKRIIGHCTSMYSSFCYVIWFFLFLPGLTNGQGILFSQYHTTPANVNPAMVTAQNFASLVVNYKNKNFGNDLSFNTTMISAYYPIIWNKPVRRIAAVGVSFLDDRLIGDQNIYHQAARINGAYSITLDTNHYLSFGASIENNIRRISFDNIHTGVQYVLGRGYDASIPNGESFGALRKSFYSFSLAVYYYKLDKNLRQKSAIGFSIFDANRPNNAFIVSESNLPRTFAFYASTQLIKFKSIIVSPEVLFKCNSYNYNYSSGLRFIYDLNNLGTKNIAFGVNYFKNSILNTVIQISHPSYSIGFSYDFAFSKQSSYTVMNSPELMASFKIPVKERKFKKKKRKKTKLKDPVENKAKITEPVKTDTFNQEIIKRRDDTTETSDNVKGKIRVIPRNSNEEIKDSVIVETDNDSQKSIVLPTIEFNFNSIELTGKAKGDLEELIQKLHSLANYHLEVIGHSDNVGNSISNKEVSTKRAKSVFDFLKEKGITNEKMRFYGMGHERPIRENNSETGRKKNRRVEIILKRND